MADRVKLLGSLIGLRDVTPAPAPEPNGGQESNDTQVRANGLVMCLFVCSIYKLTFIVRPEPAISRIIQVAQLRLIKKPKQCVRTDSSNTSELIRTHTDRRRGKLWVVFVVQ